MASTPVQPLSAMSLVSPAASASASGKTTTLTTTGDGRAFYRCNDCSTIARPDAPKDTPNHNAERIGGRGNTYFARPNGTGPSYEHQFGIDSQTQTLNALGLDDAGAVTCFRV
ncbi:hypothetical protein OQA88_2374 [Cercophora sp. LCS_1]